MLSDPSNLELHFRAAFIKLLKGLEAFVEVVPGPAGDVATGVLDGEVWRLEPQVLMHGCRPDFVLTGPLPLSKVAIFTDGYAYHASPAHNRIADDAAKRTVLRDAGLHVLGITSDDVNAYVNHQDPAPPPWLDPNLAHLLMTSFNFDKGALDTIVGGPFAWLESWIREPSSAPLGRLMDALPMFFVSGPAHSQLTDSDPLSITAGRLFQDETWPQVKGEHAAWWWQHDHLGVLVRLRSLQAIDIALVIDDSASAVQEPAFRKAWREWLRISNWLTLRSPSGHTEVLALSALSGFRPHLSRGPASKWALVDSLTIGDRAKALVRALSASSVPPPDLVGEELGEGIPVDLAWSKERVAVLVEPGEGETDAVRAQGWMALTADIEQIIAALRKET